MKKFYVYQVTFDDDSFYIGYRGTTKLPTEDLMIHYYTSSKKVKKFLEEGRPCVTNILYDNLDKVSAYELEQTIIFENIDDPKCLNQACYYGRNGFGMLSSESKNKISKSSRERWSDPEYKNKMSKIHKHSWDNNHERKAEQSKRLSGTKRPDHSKKMKGRIMSDDQKEKLKKPKHLLHGTNVSNALKGQAKSEEHKKSLSDSKKGKSLSTRKFNPVIDHFGTIFENPRRFANHYNLSKDFFDNLDCPIRYSSVYEKLKIPYTEENRTKTKRQLGFRFQEISV